MTGAARMGLGLAGAGLFVAAALVVQGLRADAAPAALSAGQTAANAPCSSCNARHARLLAARDARQEKAK